MSMWRAIATVFGPVEDRPDASALPYGTQWHDPETGITYGTDETQWYQIGNAAGGAAGGAVGPWILDALVQSLVDVDLTLLDGHRTVLPICEPVNVECVVVHLSDVVATGSVSLQLSVNGAAQGDPIVIDEGGCATATLGVFVTVCDVIGFQVTTSGDLDPTGADVTVMAQFGPPTPPIGVEANISHGISFGHQVDVQVAELVQADISHGLVLGHMVTAETLLPPVGGAMIREEVIEP